MLTEEEKMKIEEINEKIEAQKNFCEEKGLPYLISSDAICSYCNRDIFIIISLITAKETHITSCPSCKKSFVD